MFVHFLSHFLSSYYITEEYKGWINNFPPPLWPCGCLNLLMMEANLRIVAHCAGTWLWYTRSAKQPSFHSRSSSSTLIRNTQCLPKSLICRCQSGWFSPDYPPCLDFCSLFFGYGYVEPLPSWNKSSVQFRLHLWSNIAGGNFQHVTYTVALLQNSWGGR